ncbi:MAG: hypothetical protein U1C96_00880 [Gallionella sp.]|nr:hypothetical protein [Gallionella sp.]
MINQAIEAIEHFQGSSLTESLSGIESRLRGLGLNDIQQFCESRKIDDDFLTSTLAVKKIAGQINVIIHAAGILRSLQSIMEPGEVVESLSLGAGNTGRKFDLETNLRVAEYKFIDWQGGPESIRQNGIFKDFFELAEYETTKKKYLYVVGTEYPLKFFRGGRALSSVLSRQPKILTFIAEKYGPNIKQVCDYYHLKQHEVKICDVAPYIGRVL